MHKFIPLIGMLLAAVMAALPAAAQTLFKSTMPDGKVIYGDKPVPGAAKVEQTAAPPPPATKGAAPQAAREADAVRKLEGERAQGEAAQDRVRAAEKALADAEARLAGGKEPLPDERIGIASGKSRLNDAYWERQKSLEAAVEKARRDLDNAKAGR